MISAIAAILITTNIGNFFSDSSNDWVEIKNNSDQETSIYNYKLRDTATSDMFVWDSETILPSQGSCVVDVKNRLNNKGDTIFLLDQNGEQIDCKKYGDGNGGECLTDGASNSEKPESNCFIKAPQPTPTSTPNPTITPAPKPEANQPLADTVHSTPPPKPSPAVKAAKVSRTGTPEETIIEDQFSKPHDPEVPNVLPILVASIGSIGAISSAAYIAYKEYNERRG